MLKILSQNKETASPTYVLNISLSLATLLWLGPHMDQSSTTYLCNTD